MFKRYSELLLAHRVLPDIGCKEPIVSQHQIGSIYLNRVHISDTNINLLCHNKLIQPTTVKAFTT
jgi:hypothetical protein